MATVTDSLESSTIEATKLAQDAARRYLDESTAIGRAYFTSWAATTQAGVRFAFDLQNAVVQASRTMMEATAQANRTLFDQSADTVRKGQDATSKLIAAGIDVAGSALPKARG